MKNMIKALIFDMDGVIVDSEQIHMDAEVYTCKKFGLEVPLSEWEFFKGKTAVDIFDYIVKNFGSSDVSVLDMIECKVEAYLEMAPKRMELIPNSLQFIKNNRKLFQKFALTTSSKRVAQEMIFNKFNLDSLFDVIVTGDEVVNGKPHPEPYLITVEKLELNPGQCIVIEDSDNGIISAKKAGCRVVGITTSFDRERLLKSGADLVVSDFLELECILKNRTHAINV